jgi:hypothetical protein
MERGEGIGPKFPGRIVDSFSPGDSYISHRKLIPGALPFISGSLFSKPSQIDGNRRSM